MTVAIRLADIAADRETLINLLREHLNPLTDAARFDWLYAGNPHGPARVWLAADQERDIAVGSCAALPRYFYVDGKRELGCVFADFWVHPSFRFLGPAVSLQRVCMHPVKSGEFRVAYDFPQRSMIAVYRRLRVPVHDELVTHTKLLRTNRYLSNRFGSKALADALSLLANPLLTLADLRLRRARGVEIAVEAGPCGAEYSELAARVAGSYGIHVSRTADYLNWRFGAHFHHKYEFVVARRAGVLCGYLVLLDDPPASQLNVADCHGEKDVAVLISLLAFAVDLARARRRAVFAASLLSADPRRATLQSSGFTPGKQTPFIVMQPEGSVMRSESAAHLCSFTYADEAD